MCKNISPPRLLRDAYSRLADNVTVVSVGGLSYGCRGRVPPGRSAGGHCKIMLNVLYY
jgi:hypothetical protein